MGQRSARARGLPFGQAGVRKLIIRFALGETMQTFQDGSRWMLRLDQGQDLFSVLSDFARAHGIRAGAIVWGVGMLKGATVGYWNGREYAKRVFDAPHELVGLHGSIAVADGNPSIHLHVALAGPDHALVGGHLVGATVWVLNEVMVESFAGREFGRPMDEGLGLRKLDLEPGRLPPD
jgi:predicted DNA-binding protein with PD1-like motif